MVRVVSADGPRRSCSSGVLHVLARLSFRSVVSLSFRWERFRTVRGVGPDSPRCWCGRSAAADRTVRVASADGPPEPVCFASWFVSFLPFLCFRVCFKESFLGLEVDP
jgi:hypothetical protein